MQTIRRFYLYAVSLVSVEVVLWGAIGLARSFFAGEQIGGSVARLAGALSLILVGVPVFLIHWLLAQRLALKDPAERSARLRALFLYGVLLALLVPAAQNTLALLNRALLSAMGQYADRAIFGGDQTLSDNLVAIALNLLAAAYFYTALRSDWRAQPQEETLAETRRLYRYFWMLYGLILVYFGMQQVLAFLLTFWGVVSAGAPVLLASGLTLLLVGTPVWTFVWRRIQISLADPAEAGSLLRLLLLYLLSLASLGTLLTSLGFVLYGLLRFLLGETIALPYLMEELSVPLSVAVPAALVWAYYGRSLRVEMNALLEATRREELRRLYSYILAAAGLAASFVGVMLLIGFLLDLLLGQDVVWGKALRENLAAALATLAIGLPLWFFTWRSIAAEAGTEGEASDRARRSLVRKGFLYLALFAGVLGVMFSSGALLYQWISALLGQPSPELLLESAQLLRLVILFAIVLGFHWRALRLDNRLAESALARRHAQFPVLILAPPEGEFARLLVERLEREVKELPVAVHPYSMGAPDETLSAARAVILPAELLSKPPEAVRLWLQGFDGQRLVVPQPFPGWHWVTAGGDPIGQVVRMVRRLSEGEAAHPPRHAPAWMTFVYVLAGLFALQILGMLVALVISLFQ